MAHGVIHKPAPQGRNLIALDDPYFASGRGVDEPNQQRRMVTLGDRAISEKSVVAQYGDCTPAHAVVQYVVAGGVGERPSRLAARVLQDEMRVEEYVELTVAAR